MTTTSLEKLFWIGSPFFSPALAAAGWQVHTWNFEDLAVYGWDDLVRMAGWEPDVVVVADKSRPPFVLGIESFPCVTVFYCVDSHIHSYYPLYAQAFDICLVSLKDHQPLFLDKELPADSLWWFPPFAPDVAAFVPQGPYIWDCLFVGNVDMSSNGARPDFMRRLGQVVNLHIERGNYLELFPKGRILLNHCAVGDINFRVFEALGCGGCLLTPAVGHGQHELFTENVLMTYPLGDAAAAATAVRQLLADEAKQQSMRAAGLACIDAGHRASHRAMDFTRRIHGWYAGQGRARTERRRQDAPRLIQQWLRMPYLLFADHIRHPVLQRAYVQASQGKFER